MAGKEDKKSKQAIKEVKEDIQQLPETLGLMAKVEIVGE